MMQLTVGDLRKYRDSLGMGYRELGRRLQKSPEALRRLMAHDDAFPIDLKPSAELIYGLFGADHATGCYVPPRLRE